MGYKTLFEQIKTVCAWNSLTSNLRRETLAVDRTKRLLLQDVISKRARENLNTLRFFIIWAQCNSSDMTTTQLIKKLENHAILP